MLIFGLARLIFVEKLTMPSLLDKKHEHVDTAVTKRPMNVLEAFMVLKLYHSVTNC